VKKEGEKGKMTGRDDWSSKRNKATLSTAPIAKSISEN